MSRKTSLLTLGLLVAAMVVATPAFAQLTLPAGEDGFKTPASGTQVDLTDVDASAFGRGASFAQTTVALKGKPIDSANLGNIDTVIRRAEDANFSAIGDSSGPHLLQVLAMSLQSKQPVTVNTSSGSQDYNLRVCVQENNGGSGSITLTQTNSDGGFFDADFAVNPVLRFTPVGGGATIVIDCNGACGDWSLSTSNADWVHDGGGFNPGAKGVAIVQSDLLLDADCDGTANTGPTYGTGSFYPGFQASAPTFPSAPMTHDHASYSTYHKVKPPLPPGNGCRAIDAVPTQLDGASLNEATAVQVNQVKAFCAKAKTAVGVSVNLN